MTHSARRPQAPATRQAMTRSPIARSRRRFRPLFDALEDRFAPALITWSGGGVNDLWSNGANWAGGAAPADGDDVIIPATVASAEVVFDATVAGASTGETRTINRLV